MLATALSTALALRLGHLGRAEQILDDDEAVLPVAGDLGCSGMGAHGCLRFCQIVPRTSH